MQPIAIHHVDHLHIHVTVDDTATFSAISELKDIIMTTSQEMVDGLTAAAQALAAATTQIEKIGTETQTLVDKVAELSGAIANSTITPEVDAAFAAVLAQVGVLQVATQTVDDKVADAPAP